MTIGGDGVRERRWPAIVRRLVETRSGRTRTIGRTITYLEARPAVKALAIFPLLPDGVSEGSCGRIGNIR